MDTKARVGWALATGLALLCAPAAAQTEVEKNKAIVLAMVEAVNQRDLDALDDLVAEDIQRHSDATAGVVVESREQFKAFLESDFASIPDSVQVVERILAEGDLVSLQATYSGHQTGAFGPFPPSGKPLELTFIAILRIEGGKIAEIWIEWDNLGALAQLGHFPPPGDGSAKP